MCNGLLPALGEDIKAKSASEKKAERTKKTGKANKSPLLAASTYYHPLGPLPHQIDHLATINFGFKLLYISYDSIN
jgi:hypothetical protein